MGDKAPHIHPTVALGSGIVYRAAIMKTYAYIALIVPLALSACGVPDLVAHGVKAYEKSQDQKDAASQAQSQPSAQPAQTAPPARAEALPDDPPPITPPPARDSIKNEKL